MSQRLTNHSFGLTVRFQLQTKEEHKPGTKIKTQLIMKDLSGKNLFHVVPRVEGEEEG